MIVDTGSSSCANFKMWFQSESCFSLNFFFVRGKCLRSKRSIQVQYGLKLLVQSMTFHVVFIQFAESPIHSNGKGRELRFVSKSAGQMYGALMQLSDRMHILQQMIRKYVTIGWRFIHLTSPPN